jgi:hypothetical protein
MYDEPAALDAAPGDATGLALPAHAEAFRAAGAAFLTEAFQAYGSLAPDNRVVGVTLFEPFAGGNSGHKLILSVEYARPEPGLHRKLFVKFSRDFADAFRDRRRHELESEVRLAALSRLPAFPVKAPKPYFADFHAASGTGLLITERIAFGEGGVEPLKRKCMDHQLADPLAYYRATFSALARLAAAQKSGRLSPLVDRLFPFDAAAALAENPIPWDEAAVRERVAHYAVFARLCPQLLPPQLVTPAFIARLEEDAVAFLRHEAAARRFLVGDPDFVALCHWNTNIDNAWFWREPSGEVQCGLLDWGLVRQMNVATALWGGLCGADPEVWEEHLDELLALFAETLAAQGGPRLQLPKLRLHLDLAVAMLGLALMMDVPALALKRMPDLDQVTGPRDPRLGQDEVVRGFLHVFTAFLSLWERHDFGASLRRMLEG